MHCVCHRPSKLRPLISCGHCSFETSAGTAGHYWYSIYRHTYVCDYWDACLRKKNLPNVDNRTSLKPPTRFWRGLSQDYHLATFYHQSTIFNTEMVQTLWNLRWYWSITITSWFQPSIPKLLWDHAPMVWIAPSHHGSVSLYCSKGTLRSDHFRHLVGLKKYWLRVKGFLTFISTYHIYICDTIYNIIYIYQPVFGGQRFNTKCFLFGGRTPPCPNSWLYVRWMIWTTSPPSSADFPLRCCPRRRRRGPRSPHRPQPSLRRHHWRQQSESRPSWAKQNREIHWGDGIVIPCFNSFIISGVVMGRLKVDKIKMLTIVGMMFWAHWGAYNQIWHWDDFRKGSAAAMCDGWKYYKIKIARTLYPHWNKRPSLKATNQIYWQNHHPTKMGKVSIYHPCLEGWTNTVHQKREKTVKFHQLLSIHHPASVSPPRYSHRLPNWGSPMRLPSHQPRSLRRPCWLQPVAAHPPVDPGRHRCHLRNWQCVDRTCVKFFGVIPIWHSTWLSDILTIYLTSYLTASEILFGMFWLSILHSIRQSFWHMLWQFLWRSIMRSGISWHIVWLSIRHSIWQIFLCGQKAWPGLWCAQPNNRAMRSQWDILTFYLTFYRAFSPFT